MHVVLAQPRTSPADTAVYAVVYLLVTVVVPQFTDLAVVACRLHPTLHAVLGSLLRRSAAHTEHILRLHAVQIVVFDGIMTVPTGVPPATLVALHLDIALVVLAPERGILLEVFVVLLFDGGICVWGMVRGPGPIRGLCIAGAQVVGVFGVDFGGSGDGRRHVEVREYRLAGRGREGAVEAARRYWAQEVVLLRHQAMHHASLLLVSDGQVSY